MDSKDRLIPEKILAHIESVLRYCQSCETLGDFEGDSMLVEDNGGALV